MIQLSILDLEVQDNPDKTLQLLKTYFPLEKFIPANWVYKFYKRFGRKRGYSLSAFLWALIIQKAFTIPTVDLLITFLKVSAELRDFCGFDNVPDKSKFSRFKTSFEKEITDFFHSMVDLTEPICRAIDSEAAKTLIIDTTGIEVYVTENNPKFFASIQRKVQNYFKNRNKDIVPAEIITQALLSKCPKPPLPIPMPPTSISTAISPMHSRVL